MLLCAALRIEQRRGHWKLPSHRRGLASWTSRAVGDQASSREIPADVALHRSEGQPYAAAGGGEGGGEVPRERARGEEGLERGEQRGRRGQERGVGRREGALERVGVGEEGAEVVDGADEVVEVGAAELLDLGLPVPHRGAERGEQRLGAAASERPAHEGAQVLPGRDGGGELREVRLGRRGGGRRVSAARRRRRVAGELAPHRDLRREGGG